MNELFNSLANFLKRRFGSVDTRLDFLLANDVIASGEKVFEARVELPIKFSSGNQLEYGNGQMFRSSKYHNYHDYLLASLNDVIDEVGQIDIEDGVAYSLRTMFIYPIPKSLVSSKKKREAFNPSEVLPITRGTIDLDNSEKGTNDVLQEVLGFDDSQIVSKESHKRYWLNDTYVLAVELFKMPSGIEIEFYE
ncbi:RusA family crossover junction endodeoxyribonuclease [Weissella cibaria]|uniref:RusA family crossover junction endodeoxyribonuclease n=1 Tax=Weissella cibaria TaxID=137591 RepID=UPI0013D94D77|nr:RusA family crossover junction endodeoxyribonuclease [Weissella cibaria]NFA02975.1 RusA family crossover junction endodeoxyribonuclease [Weissella cibaria]